MKLHTADRSISGKFCGYALRLMLAAAAVGTCATRANEESNPAHPKKSDPHEQFKAQLSSGDSEQVAAALKGIKALAARAPGGRRAKELQVIMDAKLYEQANTTALELIASNPLGSDAVAALEKLRSQALLDAGKPAEALAAAKAYYNTARLKDTADAINTVALCLVAAHPDDADIAHRFKQQQVNGASTQPSASEADQSILSAIPIDGKPFQDAISKLQMDHYDKYVMKGNLLLASGQPKEAKNVFEKAADLAPEGKAAEAVENVARAIRAQYGRVGSANAYIISKRDGANGQ